MNVVEILKRAHYRSKLDLNALQMFSDDKTSKKAHNNEAYARQIIFLSAGADALDEYYSKLFVDSLSCNLPVYFHHILLNFSMQMLSVRSIRNSDNEKFLIVNSFTDCDLFAATAGGQSRIKILFAHTEQESRIERVWQSLTEASTAEPKEVPQVSFVRGDKDLIADASVSFGCVCIFLKENQLYGLNCTRYLDHLSPRGHMMVFATKTVCEQLSLEMKRHSSFSVLVRRNPDPYIPDESDLSHVLFAERYR